MAEVADIPFVPFSRLSEAAAAGAAAVPPAAGPGEEGAAAGDDEALPSFEASCWEVPRRRYGLIGLLRCREGLLPIAKPPETEHLKFLICFAQEERPELDRDPPELREARPPRGGSGDRGKGKGKGRDKLGGKGRFVENMGKTEILQGTSRGQWWWNIGQDSLDVIVREQFSLNSPEIWKVPPGHYVQQAGPVEVFVSGQALGLQRMPVLPRGWVTVDATAVGGPKYIEPTASPRWRVVFSSGSSKGDIVVRDGMSLESGEVAVLVYGTYVEQSGPQEVLEDGIIRMPIVFAEGVGMEPSIPSQPPKSRQGWVTCDATSQGGPRFFEPCSPELEQPVPAPAPSQPQTAEAEGGRGEREHQHHRPQAHAGDAVSGGGGGGGGGSSWDKNRLWKVVNLDAAGGERQLAVVARAEPYAPGTGRVPPEDMIVRWLLNDDIVEQVGHSKKMRGYMVMPVRIRMEGGGARHVSEPGQAEGWVTRRVVDKSRDHNEGTWFEELR